MMWQLIITLRLLFIESTCRFNNIKGGCYQFVLTFIAPTTVVVSAELWWLHSTMEYIRTNLKGQNKRLLTGSESKLCLHRAMMSYPMMQDIRKQKTNVAFPQSSNVAACRSKQMREGQEIKAHSLGHIKKISLNRRDQSYIPCASLQWMHSPRWWVLQ